MQNKTKKLIKGSLASALFSPDLNLASGPFPLMRGFYEQAYRSTVRI